MGHKMAILVDGGFRLKHAKNLRGEKTAEARASELVKYCGAHTRKENAELYRVFHYDCESPRQIRESKHVASAPAVSVTLRAAKLSLYRPCMRAKRSPL